MQQAVAGLEKAGKGESRGSDHGCIKPYDGVPVFWLDGFNFLRTNYFLCKDLVALPL